MTTAKWNQWSSNISQLSYHSSQATRQCKRSIADMDSLPHTPSITQALPPFTNRPLYRQEVLLLPDHCPNVKFQFHTLAGPIDILQLLQIEQLSLDLPSDTSMPFMNCASNSSFGVQGASVSKNAMQLMPATCTSTSVCGCVCTPRRANKTALNFKHN